MRLFETLAPHENFIEHELNENYSLSGDKPLIVRNDGQVFEIKYDRRVFPIDHPYLIKDANHTSMEDITDLLYNRFHCFVWFYEHTGKGTTQQNMRYFIEHVIAHLDYFAPREEDKERLLSEFIPYRDADRRRAVFPVGAAEDTLTTLININNATNQEFLRFRTQTPFYGGNQVEVFFKVSSVGFDWGKIIENIIYSHAPQIKDIIIATDTWALPQSKTYEAGGSPLIQITPSEFMELNRTPVIESLFRLNPKLPHYQDLQEGLTYSEIGYLSSPRNIRYLIESVNRGDWDIK